MNGKGVSGSMPVPDMSGTDHDGAPGRPGRIAELLPLLVCPCCRHQLQRSAEGLFCAGCGRRYPIRDGIPVLLVEAADSSARDEEDRK